MSCYKQKSSLTYRNLKGFTCLPKEHGQTGWDCIKENRNRSQGFTEYFSFHCLSSSVVVTVVVFTFFLFLNKYMHTQTPFMCLLLNCLWLHWELLSICYSRKNPAKAHLTRSKLDFSFLFAIPTMLVSLRWAYWLVLTFQLCLFFFWPRAKIWASPFRNEVFKTCHIIACCLQNLFQLLTNKLNTIFLFFPAAKLIDSPDFFKRGFMF